VTDGIDGWNMVGEAKWVERFTSRDWNAFNQNVDVAGTRAERAVRCLWIKDDIDPSIPNMSVGMRVFRPTDMTRHARL
jgi:hypothetical protein